MKNMLVVFLEICGDVYSKFTPDSPTNVWGCSIGGAPYRCAVPWENEGFPCNTFLTTLLCAMDLLDVNRLVFKKPRRQKVQFCSSQRLSSHYDKLMGLQHRGHICVIHQRNLKQVDINSLYSMLHHSATKSRLSLPAFILLAVVSA